MIGSVLDQTEIWTANGHIVKVADMDDRYRGNVVRWLERRAESLVWNYFTGQIATFLCGPLAPQGEMAFENISNAIDRDEDAALADPIAWLRSKPLVVELLKPQSIDGASSFGGEVEEYRS